VSNEKTRNLSVFTWSIADILRGDFAKSRKRPAVDQALQIGFDREAEIFPDLCGAPGLRYVIFHFLRCLVLGHFSESVRDITIA
jgi:hypothetical protein